jgi:hypothetical protein
MGLRSPSVRRAKVAAVLMVLGGLCLPGSAYGKAVRYHGLRLNVPANWPVYHLTASSRTCVRFNRHALYLGAPSAVQDCPAHTVGRTEAILVAPGTAHAAGDAATRAQLPAVTASAAQPSQGSEALLALHGTHVTVTWHARPGLVARAIGVHRLTAETTSTAVARAQSATRARAAARARPAAVSGGVYTGPGFDPCDAPTTPQMSAWHGSRYHAIGVYIGGTNEGCSQPNLTSAWVRKEIAAGWHLIPTYVGLQAPSNSCGCASLSSSRATAQGKAAASDAIDQAQAVGIGTGSPIYFDMEAYSTGGQSTRAVLKFLAAWTAALHAGGYLSGVYSSGASGIADLSARYQSGYDEPDDIWIADWNERESVSDPYVPSADWASHQRVHQYDGGHNETHGGVTLNIDGDYLDASTAGPGAVITAPSPSLRVQPETNGAVRLHATWPGSTAVAAWRIMAGESADALSKLGTPIKGGADTTILVHSQFPYFAIVALDSSGNPLATTKTIITRPTLAIYGRSAFVPTHGPVGVPVSCFTGADCQISMSVTSGSAVIATTQPKAVPAETGAILYFKLSHAGRTALSHAGGHLPVRVHLRDVSGVTSTASLKLVRYATHGARPQRSLTPSPAVGLVGTTDFVHAGRVGGLLAGCFGEVPCKTRTTITAGHTTIADAGQFLGAHELGYLIFRLTAKGRRLLKHAHGNHLPVTVTLTSGAATATGRIVLVSFT